jgi:thiamine pyrophosphokinase
MRALVVADGELPSGRLMRELAGGADLVVAADGGADKALSAGLRVDAVVGDLDSLSLEARAVIPPGSLHHAPSADETDLQKAIEFALARGATAIDIAAAGGGRADHALANLSVLTVYRRRAALRVVDDLFEVELVDGEVSIDAPPGTVVSLVAIGLARGVTTRGLRWNLSDYTLAFSPYGVHNEVEQPPATVSVESGDVLLFRGRWVERHV